MLTETTHTVVAGDARSVEPRSESVDLVVTSPPYPMVEMWDDVFEQMNSEVGEALAEGRGQRAFDLMHEELDEVWSIVADTVQPGGFVCINVGDATRSIGDSFQLFPNATRITSKFRDLGFHTLPRIYWQKPTNSPASFMGSGTLPPNAYPKLEHEHILLFRKGPSKSFEPKEETRYESAYFYEERNTWFADQWDGVGGESQELGDEDSGGDREMRDRSGAFPFQVPYRLVNMFSLYGDTVYDPFLGTGTTSMAAMVAGRNSIGVEIDKQVAKQLIDRVGRVRELSKEVISERIEGHREYLQSRERRGKETKYEADNYPFAVVTQQEQGIQFYEVSDVDVCGDLCDVKGLKGDGHDTIGVEVLHGRYSENIPVSLSRFTQESLD